MFIELKISLKNAELSGFLVKALKKENKIHER